MELEKIDRYIGTLRGLIEENVEVMILNEAVKALERRRGRILRIGEGKLSASGGLLEDLGK